jgi:release factor glutamine methyltransferase
MARSLGDLLSWGNTRLKEAGVDDFSLSTELLLRSVLGLSRSQLLLNLRDTIPIEKEKAYQELIEKRSERIPLQYLTGIVEFYNIELKSDSRALIPRPETEILVETVLNKLSHTDPLKILDIGVGSGNISIALAKNIPKSNITGVDISQDALDLASENSILNDVGERVSFIRGDILDGAFIKTLVRFDCVVSNPPYVATRDRETLQPEVAKYEPPVAIFAGDDPLIFFKTIVNDIWYILNCGGLLAFEVGLGQAGDIQALMKPAFERITIIKDLAGLDRIVTGVYAGTDKK